MKLNLYGVIKQKSWHIGCLSTNILSKLTRMSNGKLHSPNNRRNNGLRQRAGLLFFFYSRIDLKAFLIFESIWPVFGLPRGAEKGSSERFTDRHVNSRIAESWDRGSKEALTVISWKKQGTMDFNWKLKLGALLTWFWLPSWLWFVLLPFTELICTEHICLVPFY